jgi:hypothetical protein
MDGSRSPLPGRNGWHGRPTGFSRPAGTHLIGTGMSVTRVIERCPSCGVEHETPVVGGCEACGTALRHWCRTHSREIGWLGSPACERCAQEARRPTPRPPRRSRIAPFAARGVRRHLRLAVPPRAPELPASAPPDPAVRGDPALYHAPTLTGRNAGLPVVRTCILVLIAGVAGAGLLAWAQAHPRDARGLMGVLMMLVVARGMVVAVTQLFGGRLRRRR